MCGGDGLFGGSVEGIGCDDLMSEHKGELKTTGSANVNMMTRTADG
jgi:hypothetical protein